VASLTTLRVKLRNLVFNPPTENLSSRFGDTFTEEHPVKRSENIADKLSTFDTCTPKIVASSLLAMTFSWSISPLETDWVVVKESATISSFTNDVCVSWLKYFKYPFSLKNP
jgi:hypothetical protein